MDRRVVLFAGCPWRARCSGSPGRCRHARSRIRRCRIRRCNCASSRLSRRRSRWPQVRRCISTSPTRAPASTTWSSNWSPPGIDQVLFGANLQPGQSDTAEVTFSQPGTWELYCPLDQHRDRGMLASVQVQEASEAPVPPRRNQLPRRPRPRCQPASGPTSTSTATAATTTPSRVLSVLASRRSSRSRRAGPRSSAKLATTLEQRERDCNVNGR